MFRNVTTSVALALFLGTCIVGTMSASASAKEPVKPLRALLVIGGCCHDYEVQKDLLSKGISERAHIEVTVAYDPDKTTKHLNPVYENPNWADGFDVVIHDECTADVTDKNIIDRILDPHRQGLPAVVLHCGMHSFRGEGYPNLTPWFEFTGLQTTGHGPQVPIDITFTAKHPITKGMANWVTIKEELYNNTTGKLLDTAVSLASGHQTLKNKAGETSEVTNILIWTNEYADNTRVFATTLGHNNETVADPRYLDLITRGLLWSCDKLNDDYLKTPPAK